MNGHDVAMRQWWWALVPVVFAVGCAPECENDGDCATGFECTKNACVPPSGGGDGRNKPAPDAGYTVIPVNPDSGTRDVGVDAGDAGFADGGVGVDAGDAGAGVDGGPTPSPTTYGFVWAGELSTDQGSVYHAYGLLVDESSAQYDVSEANYPDAVGNPCVLRVKRLISGAPSGLVARDMVVVPGPQLNASFALLPVGDGRFEPLADPVERIYTEAGVARVSIYSDGSADSVDTVSLAVEAPPAVLEISPPLGSTFYLSAGTTLYWVPSGSLNARVTTEVADVDREVVLTCTAPDTGQYQLPAGAVSAFLTEAPTRPLVLEVRHDKEVTVTGSRAGQSFPVTFRASWGIRYPAQ